MYDEERKKQFLSSFASESMRHKYGLYLERAGKVEEKFDCRLEDMTNEQAHEVALVFGAQRNATVKLLEHLFATYKEWCEENGIQFKPDVSAFSFDTLSLIRTHMVFDPAQLQQKLDLVFHKESVKSTDNIFRAYLWMMFMGIGRQEAVEITNEHVDLSVPCVFVGDEVFKIPAEAFPCFYVLATSKSFVVPNPNHSDWTLDRYSSNQFLRGTVGDNRKYKNIEARIGLASTSKGVSLRPRDIAYSGVFYRTYLRELETGSPDFTQYVQDWLASSEVYKNQDKRSKQKRYQNVLSSVRKDYKNWKTVFTNLE